MVNAAPQQQPCNARNRSTANVESLRRAKVGFLDTETKYRTEWRVKRSHPSLEATVPGFAKDYVRERPDTKRAWCANEPLKPEQRLWPPHRAPHLNPTLIQATQTNQPLFQKHDGRWHRTLFDQYGSGGKLPFFTRTTLRPGYATDRTNPAISASSTWQWLFCSLWIAIRHDLSLSFRRLFASSQLLELQLSC